MKQIVVHISQGYCAKRSPASWPMFHAEVSSFTGAMLFPGRRVYFCPFLGEIIRTALTVF